MSGFMIALVVISLLLLAQVSYSSYLMLYTWNEASKRDRYRASATFAEPHKSFTVLLLARHEEDVIQRTIQCVLNANYPKDLMEFAADGTPIDPKGRTVLPPGTRLLLRFAGGGGYGPPERRDRAAAAHDTREGWTLGPERS